MVSERLYLRMCMSGLQEERFQRGEELRRQNSRARRDREWAEKIGRAEPYFVRKLTAPVQRLISAGRIEARERCDIRLGAIGFELRTADRLAKRSDAGQEHRRRLHV